MAAVGGLQSLLRGGRQKGQRQGNHHGRSRKLSG